jgi:hypothetical protein
MHDAQRSCSMQPLACMTAESHCPYCIPYPKIPCWYLQVPFLSFVVFGEHWATCQVTTRWRDTVCSLLDVVVPGQDCPVSGEDQHTLARRGTLHQNPQTETHAKKPEATAHP